MELSTQWWVLAGLLVVAELATGTFYLLMLALGAVAGALAAHGQLPLPAQLAAAAIVGGACAVIWHVRRRRKLAGGQAMGLHPDADLGLDLGHKVHVARWMPAGSAEELYRGASWQARLKHPVTGQTPEPGHYRICAMQGNRLLLERE